MVITFEILIVTENELFHILDIEGRDLQFYPTVRLSLVRFTEIGWRYKVARHPIRSDPGGGSNQCEYHPGDHFKLNY